MLCPSCDTERRRLFDDVITEVNELLSYVQFYRDRSSVEHYTRY